MIAVKPFSRLLLTLAMLALLPASAVAEPLTLPEAYALALSNNPQIIAQENALEQASAQVGKAWTYLGPSVNFQASRSWNNEVTFDNAFDDPREPGLLTTPTNGQCPTETTGQGFGQPISSGTPVCILKRPQIVEAVVRPSQSTTFTLSGNQPIFSGQTIPGITGAWEREDMAEGSLRYTREQILYNVAQMYFNVAASERLVRLQRQSLDNLNDHLASAKAKYQVGQLSRMGVLQAEIEVTRAQAQLSRARNDYHNTRAALANLIGIDSIEDLQSAEELTTSTFVGAEDYPSNATAAALEHRGDFRASVAATELARSNRNLAWMAFSPTLMLTGQLQRTDTPGAFAEKNSWAVMLNLNVPLLQGGGRYFDVRSGFAGVRQAEAQQLAKRNDVEFEVKQAISNREVTLSNVAVAERQLSLARENYSVSRLMFENGLATTLDVIDANQALIGAEIGFLREQMNLRLELLNLYRSMGLLLQSLGIEPRED